MLSQMRGSPMLERVLFFVYSRGSEAANIRAWTPHIISRREKGGAFCFVATGGSNESFA